jgi:hypothetical protein
MSWEHPDELSWKRQQRSQELETLNTELLEMCKALLNMNAYEQCERLEIRERAELLITKASRE